MPAKVREALEAYGAKERVGIAKTWEPEEGDYVIGEITAARQASQYQNWIITIEVVCSGSIHTQEYATKVHYVGVWLNADLELKLNKEELGLTGRRIYLQFDGWLTKEENPRLKNDMKLYTVHEMPAKAFEQAVAVR